MKKLYAKFGCKPGSKWGRRWVGKGAKIFFFIGNDTWSLKDPFSRLMSKDEYQQGTCGLSSTMVKKILEVPWFSFFHVTNPN